MTTSTCPTCGPTCGTCPTCLSVQPLDDDALVLVHADGRTPVCPGTRQLPARIIRLVHERTGS